MEVRKEATTALATAAAAARSWRTLAVVYGFTDGLATNHHQQQQCTCSPSPLARRLAHVVIVVVNGVSHEECVDALWSHWTAWRDDHKAQEHEGPDQRSCK